MAPQKKKQETRYMFDFKQNKTRFLTHSVKKNISLQKIIEESLKITHPKLFKDPK